MHVVMVPWVAFGHMIPQLQLAIALAESGIHVSFISTPKNIQRLPKLSPTVTPLIHLVALPLPEVPGLPEGCEATLDLPFEKFKYLKDAYALLKQPLKRFLESASPDCMFVDLPVDWAAEAAAECGGLRLFGFTMFTSATSVFFGPPEYLTGEGQKKFRPSLESMTAPPEWVTFPSMVAYREFEASGAHPGYYGEDSSGSTVARRIATTLSACEAVTIRSCREFEGEYLNIYQKLLKKPVIPVGLLPPGKSQENTDQEWKKIFDWLDDQKPKSVVFVGFGSECKLTKDQVHEIAYGLELSELPFLWALRKPSWAVEDDDALPTGFRHRTSGRGVVGIGWAPQKEILAHPSIGGSLFHSGWGSVIETLQFGHALIVLPFIIDQGLNARLLVEKGMAVEVSRREDGTFSRDDIAKSLRLAMVMEEGEKLRVRAREAATIFGDRKLHQSYIDELVKYLKGGVAKEM